MKKIGGKKKKSKFFNKQVKKTLPYQLLIISLILLAILILIWVVLFILGKVSYLPKDKGLEGELGTLMWDLGKQNITLEILNYNISGDNQTIEVNINWSSGVEDLRAILIDFEGGVECNYTNTSVPNFGTNQTYIINYTQTSCGLNFENITNLSAYAQINIPLIQINPLENVTLYNDDDKKNIIDLDNYFDCLGEIDFNVVEYPENLEVWIIINETTNNISFSREANWYGVQKFDLTASCDGDVLNVLTNGENMSFYIIAIDGNRVLINNAPEFLEDDCDDLEWEENTNYFIDMEDCFEDDDGDDLDFRYGNASGYNDNLTIEVDGDELTLIPDTDWFGTGYFYIYADDSTDETSGRVYFTVVENTTSVSSSTTTSTTTSDILKIKSSSPSSSTVNIFTNKTKRLVITAENYESIKWYLDGELIQEGSLSYNFKKIDEGDYVIKVEVVNGTVTDSKTWNLVVQEEVIEDGPFDSGELIFYLIIGMILIIIFLVLWLFIAEKNSRKKKIDYIGFGVSGSS